ncbi:MAG: CHAT domain-containing tetratricopeptide repeat protein [Pyrinomonadaceae bacterium]
MAGGQAHAYKISLVAGQCLRVVVEQRGIIVTATLFDPTGKEMVKADNPGGAYGPVYVSAVSESPGDYRLEIRSTEAWANAGRYQVAIEDSREATPADRARIAAEKNYADGRQLLERPALAGEKPLQKFEAALAKFEGALAYWQTTGDRHWIALTEYCLGVAHRSLGDRRAAAEHFEKSLKIQLDERDWRLRATVFNDGGVNYMRMDELEPAARSLNEALRIYQSHQDRRGTASALNNIGNLRLAQGKYREARESFQQALPLRHAENDRNGETILLSNLAGAADRLGEPWEALEGWSKALQIWQELRHSGEVRVPDTTLAVAFNNVALAYDKLGEWQKALENYNVALSLYKTAAPVEAAKTLDNIGELYAVLGDADSAIKYYDMARSFAEGKDPVAMASVLSHIGQEYVSEGKLAGALAYFERSLALSKGTPEEANTLTNIGNVYVLQGSPRKALESYAQALKLSEDSEDRRGQAVTLHKMGEAHFLLGEHTAAMEDFNRALPIWKSVADLRGEAATLHGMALVQRGQGELAEALSRSRESLTIIESLRTKVTSQRLRTTYFATQQNNYELYIDLRMRSYRLDNSPEHLAAALEASEQARARSLVDTLSESRGDISRGVSEALLKQEREAQQRLNAKARIQMELLGRKHSDEDGRQMEREVSEAIAKYDEVKAKIRASSPAYAHLTQPRSLTLSEIQQLLDDDTLLLEYFLGEQKSYLWLVGKDSIFAAELSANRSTIDAKARAFYESLAAPPSGLNNPPFDPEDASALSRMLLGPVAERLGGKRLLIVGDGVLQYLPFGALPAPSPQSGVVQNRRTAAQPAATPYLVQGHEIVNLPSASVLAVLRTETFDRKPTPLSVAVLANPVFNADDDRLKSAGAPRGAARGPVIDRAREEVLRSGLTLDPLPATEREAFAIRDAVMPSAQVKLALGFEASRATVMALQGQNYRVVHFATHGIFNAEHPELSGLVLSMMDSQGRPQDGILRLHDIYNLKLPADLVVLSACSTGMGSIIKGEGLVGLTRGFMYAGSPRVVASLWRVEDLGTSELMRRFYQHMAGEGLSPAAALRQTQLDMLQGRRWRSPYYWAGFVLQGEWKGSRLTDRK